MELPRKKRWIVFVFIISLIFIMNMDQGIVSGTTTELKKDMLLSNEQLGMLGSILFIGCTVGCILSFTLINKFDRRKMLLTAIASNTIALFALITTKIYYIILLCRIISGLMLSFVGIYTSVWCDQFGIWKRRALMLGISHITSPFGYITGYVLGIFLDWKITFYIQATLLIIHFPILFWLIDPIYFSTTLRSIKQIQTNDGTDTDKASHFEYGEIINNINYEFDSFFEDIPLNTTETKNSDQVSTWTEFKFCLKSFVFNMSTLALAFIFMIISGIQFWSNDYMENILNISNDYKRLIIFGSITLTAPTVGILVSGIITTRIGGYETKHAILIPLFGASLVSVVANFVVITNNVIVFSVSFWFYLFFGSFCLPPLTGIIMASVPAQYSGNANALSTLFYNVAGKFPAPYLYGMLKQYTTVCGAKFPMVCLLNSALFGVVCLALGSNYRYRHFGNDKSNQYDVNPSPSKEKAPIDNKERLFNFPELSFPTEKAKESINCEIMQEEVKP